MWTGGSSVQNFQDPKYFVCLYQNSLKDKKGKDPKTKFANNLTEANLVNNVNIAQNTYLNVLNFLID